MIQAYGGCCLRCGECDPAVLTLDHIYDDGTVERDLHGVSARGGTKFYGRLKKEGWPTDRVQLLCFNCNIKKEAARRRAGVIKRWGEKETIDYSAAHANVPPPAHNTSGIKGVYWNAQKQKWHAKVSFKGQGINAGFYADIRDAARAYANKAKETWGEMAQIATEDEINAAYEKSLVVSEPKIVADALDLF